MNIVGVLAENKRLSAENQRLQREKAALDQRIARFEKQVARLEAEVQMLKDTLEAAQRQGKRQATPFSNGATGPVRKDAQTEPGWPGASA